MQFATKQAIEVFSLLKLKYESQYTDGCGILVLIWVSTVWVMQFINLQIYKINIQYRQSFTCDD